MPEAHSPGPHISEVSSAQHVREQIYHPLQSWETRLIELERGYFDQPLSCRLLTAELIYFEGIGVRAYSKIVPYEALSYCWGKASDSCSILLNGFPYTITNNLAAALRALRSDYNTSGPRILWVDALCIDQANDAEKSVQIRNMLAIFQKAQRVIAWLGEDEDSSSARGFDWISQVRSPQVFSPFPSSPDYILDCQTAFQGLLRRPWFHRTWIRQEVFAARHLDLQLGRWLKATWDDFQNAYRERHMLDERFAKQGTDCVAWSPEIEQSFEILSHDYNQKGVKERNFFTTLETGVSFDTSDDKDRVYGVLGMVNNNELSTRVHAHETEHRPPRPSMEDFPVDYGKSVSEVFQDVIRFALSYDDHLDILCRYEARPDSTPDLPSWAVDWRKPVHRSPFEKFPPLRPDQRLIGGPFESLARPRLYVENAFPSIRRDDHILKLHGCRIGSMGDLRPLAAHEEYGGKPSTWYYVSKEWRERQYYEAAVKLDPSILPNEIPDPGSSGRTDPLWRSQGLVVVPPFCKPGDLVVSLWPCNRPFALRPHVDFGGFVFLGPVALVSKEYDGDMMPLLRLPETLRAEQFSLI